MPVPQDPRPARRRSLSPYVWIWVSVGTAALAYLVLLGTQPQFLAGLSQEPSTQQAAGANQQDLARAVADMEPMRQTVGQLRMDVAKIKTVVEENFRRDKMVEERLTIVEQSVSVQKPAEKLSEGSKATGSEQKSAAVQPTVLNAKPQAPLETSSISRSESTETVTIAQREVETVMVPPPERKPPVPTRLAAAVPAPTPASPSETGILLATGPSIAALQLNWTLLSDRNKDALGHLEPRYTVSGPANNKTYKLVAGPLGSKVQGEIVCSALSQRGYPCKVGTFAGTVLPPAI